MVNERLLEGVSVLVVEDEYFIASQLKQVLKQSGAKAVRLSGNIEDACERIKAESYQVALVDIDIRGEQAYAVAQELQRQRVPFAFMTGFSRSAIPRRFADIPVWGKPFDPKRIASDLQTLRKAAA